MNSSKSLPIKILVLIISLIVLAAAIIYTFKHENLWASFTHQGATLVKLPTPAYHSAVSLEETLKQRRSVRQYKTEALSLQQLAQLLWAAQGITSPTGFRTAPSAGALYPLELYVISGNVRDLPAGIYRYLPEQQSLELLVSGDKRKELAAAVHEQNDITNGSVGLVLTAKAKKSIAKYGNRGQRFVYLEAGHATENLLLQSVSLGLGTVAIGVFDEAPVQHLLNIPKDEEPIYVLPLGKI